MDVPKNYLHKFKPSGRKLRIASERQELIQQCVDRINAERVGTEFKPVTWKQINGLVAFFRPADLYWLMRECDKNENFGKTFFGILKSTRIPKNK